MLSPEERQAINQLQFDDEGREGEKVDPLEVQDTEEGIDFIEIDPPAFTTAVEAGYNGLIWSVDMVFQVKSPMRTFDIFLVDPTTNEEIGFLGTMDGRGADPYIEYMLPGVLVEGTYHPLTGNPDNPISYDIARTEPGLHIIRLVGTNEQGETFSSDAPVFYGVNQPVLELNKRSGVYEFDADNPVVSLSGSVYDADVEEMKAGGIDVSQADNKVVYTMPGKGGGIGGGTETVLVSVDEDGEFSTEIEVDSDLQPFNVQMYAENKATVRNYYDNKYLYYVQEGTPYGTAISNSERYGGGDDITVTLAMNNMTNMKQAKFSFIYEVNSDIKLVNVEAHHSLKEKFDIDVVDTEIYDGVVHREITASLIDDLTDVGVSGPQISLVDLSYKVDDNAFSSIESLLDFNVSYSNVDSEEEYTFGISVPYVIERDYSFLKSNINMEAFQYPNDLGPLYMDYEEAGATAKVTDETGMEIPLVGEGISSASGFFNAHLPLTDKTFAQEVTMPGHFTVMKTFTIGIKENGEIKPYSKYLDYTKSPGGDVNQDNVIDIHDALAIQTYWKTDNREADINYDGTVDELDMQFVIDNYLMKNPWLENKAPEPVIEHNGKNLSDILRELGMVELVPPELEIESPVDNLVTNKELITVKGTVTDDDFDKLVINDEEIPVENGSFETRLMVNEGENMIRITAFDLAGNETTVKRKVTVILTEPEIANLEPSEDRYVMPGEKVYVSFRGPQNGKASFLVTLPMSNMSNENVINMEEIEPGLYKGTWQVPANISVPEANIQVELIDEAGNRTAKQAEGKLYIFKESVERIAGNTRYDTAVETSKTGWATSDTVILARGDDYADALAGVPLAYALDSPILLTRVNKLLDSTKEEIKRLGATNIIILGGEAAISEKVGDELTESGLNVRRIGGDTRYETASKIAEEVAPEGSSHVVIASGLDFPDALSVASHSARGGLPILLTNGKSLPEATSKVIREMGARETIVVGGSSVVSEAEMGQLPNPTRLSGEDRYQTNIVINEYFGVDSKHMYVSTGKNYPDVLAGAVLAAKQNTGILLVHNIVPDEVGNYIIDQEISRLSVFGGSTAVSNEVLHGLREYLR